MERQVKLFKIDELTIEYSVIGKGDPVLIMHGGHSNCLEEFGYQALIDNGFSIITPSRPGYGRTSKEIGENLIGACDYYAKLLTHLGIKKVHIIAVSAGGASGIYFASRHPDKVLSLTLESAVTKEWLTSKDKEYRAARLLFHPSREKIVWKLISNLNNRFPNFLFKQIYSSFSQLPYHNVQGRLTEKDMEAFRRMNHRQRSGEGFFIDLEQTNQIDDGELARIACPTLIIHSQNDSAVPIEHANHAHQCIRSSKQIILNSWGHLIWLGDMSRMVDEKVIEFLRTV